MRYVNSSDKTDAMDYRSALASAVAWLGDRYLLARPVKRLAQDDRCKAGLTVASAGPRADG